MKIGVTGAANHRGPSRSPLGLRQRPVQLFHERRVDRVAVFYPVDGQPADVIPVFDQQ